jgi:hypothetical protein
MTLYIDFTNPALYAIAVWLFYVQFAGAISVYRLWLKGALNPLNECAFLPLLAAFFLLDVVLNYTVLIPALGLPPRGCVTMSERFQVYHLGINEDGTAYFPTAFQKAFGTFVCVRLLNPIDPTGNHC